MSGAIHKINSSVDNALDKNATDGSDRSDQALVASLWDRTFCSYPPEMVIKLPYYFQNHYVQDNDISSPNQFRVNSLFDFDLTGTGNQPLGRDTWAAIYDYYKVIEVRLHATFVSTQHITGTTAQTTVGALTDGNWGAAVMAPAYVGGMLDIVADPPDSLTAWQHATMVTPNSTQRFTPIQRLGKIASRPNTTLHYQMTWTPDMFDTAVLNDATQNTWTPVGSNPANVNYFTPIVYNSNSANGTNNKLHYSFELKTEMLVAFKNVTRSLLNTVN